MKPEHKQQAVAVIAKWRDAAARSLHADKAAAGMAALLQALVNEPDEWLTDAEQYGSALSTAAWAAIEAWNREEMGTMTPAILNNLKRVIRAAILSYGQAILAAPQAPAASHSDDEAVDRFAAAMKAKLAKQREKGYGGWDDSKACPDGSLQPRLLEHTYKGDPVDVGNFAMMLFCRGEPTTPKGKPVAMLVKQPDGHESLLRYSGPAAEAFRGMRCTVDVLGSMPAPKEDSASSEPNCDRSVCGDFSAGRCDNLDCPARRDSPATLAAKGTP